VSNAAIAAGKQVDPTSRRRHSPKTTPYRGKAKFGRYAGTEIKIDGVEHLMMRVDDILGVLES